MPKDNDGYVELHVCCTNPEHGSQHVFWSDYRMRWCCKTKECTLIVGPHDGVKAVLHQLALSPLNVTAV